MQKKTPHWGGNQKDADRNTAIEMGKSAMETIGETRKPVHSTKTTAVKKNQEVLQTL